MDQLIRMFNSKNYYLIKLLLLGLISGLAFTLVTFTIPYHLTISGYPTHIIGVIFLASLPYCFKPVWAPFIDNYSIPVFCKKLGQRRGWALVTQTSLTLSTSTMLIISPPQHLSITAILAFIISFCAATQDIIVDAYRIEITKTKPELAISATFSVVGFRIGILIGSVGALYLSYIFGWYFVYLATTFLTLIGLPVILYIKEPILKVVQQVATNKISFKQYFIVIHNSILTLKHNQPHWKLIMLFIILYKASDVIPMAMSSPLFIDLSFTSLEIANISKAYGLLVMILGTFLGGLLVSKLGAFKGIIICGCIQTLSPIMFLLLSMVGHNINIFITTITLQNFCCGLGSTALVIYFSTICSNEFIATQFAIIASFSSLVRIFLSSISSFLVSYCEWTQFFLFNAILSILFIPIFLKAHKIPSNH